MVIQIDFKNATAVIGTLATVRPTPHVTRLFAFTICQVYIRAFTILDICTVAGDEIDHALLCCSDRQQTDKSWCQLIQAGHKSSEPIIK